MKEDTLNTATQAAGKYRIKNSGLKETSSFADGALNSLEKGDSYQATAKAVTDAVTESANQILEMATGNAKKAYGFVNKYKYQTLGVIGVAGLAGAGYIFFNRRSVKAKAAPVLKKAKKTATKRISKK